MGPRALRAGGGADAGSVTLEELSWAQQLVLSRAFASDINKGERGATSGAMGSRAAPARCGRQLTGPRSQPALAHSRPTPCTASPCAPPTQAPLPPPPPPKSGFQKAPEHRRRIRMPRIPTGTRERLGWMFAVPAVLVARVPRCSEHAARARPPAPSPPVLVRRRGRGRSSRAWSTTASAAEMRLQRTH